MQIFNRNRTFLAAFLAIAVSFFSACGSKPPESNSAGVTALSQVPAVRLNYRYEADVPVPTLPGVTIEERNAAVQADFDTNRTQEQLDRTITSPDKKRVLAVYRNVTDLTSEVRLDMYTPEGKLLRKVTADTMAVHFPDTIIWSPDSSSVAFVAMLRTLTPLAPSTTPATASSTTPLSAEPASPVEPTPQAAATPAAPTGVLTFRTEQIYICNADGAGIKSLTQNEGLIYFYYVWSPDSTMLAALATTEREWRYLTVLAEQKGEVMVPLGRPRVVEKNGRERRLDDNLTAVHPVWSPDSAKVAAAFETQIRIYDAGGVNPTQAAIPLKNQLLISSQAYDRQQQQIAANSTDPNAAPSASPAEPLTTLPDEKLLVSYNPIVELGWTSEDLLYAKTAYLKRMKLETENVTSFARWHRLVFSAQPLTPVANK